LAASLGAARFGGTVLSREYRVNHSFAPGVVAPVQHVPVERQLSVPEAQHHAKRIGRLNRVAHFVGAKAVAPGKRVCFIGRQFLENA